MRINQNLVKRELTKIISLPYCLIAGDEPSLVLNTEKMLQDAVMQQGEYEREVVDIDNRFDWSEIRNISQNYSLFTIKKLIQLRFIHKPDAKSFKGLAEVLQESNSDTYYLITMSRLDNKTLKNKTLSMIERNGCVVTVYPPDYAQLPSWIQGRAQELNVNLNADTVDFIAIHNEGNFLAIDQLLNQLAFLYGSESISLEMVQDLSSENSNFVAFDLSHALLTADLSRIYRIIQSLRSEGEVPTLVNWVLQKEIAILQKMHSKINAGATEEMVLNDVWERNKPLYRMALNRINARRLKHLSSMVVQIDMATKGQLNENPWNALMRTAFAFAGKRLLPLSAQVSI